MLTERYYQARWIQPKLGSFERSSLKREAQWLLRKIRPSPLPVGALRAISYKNWQLGTYCMAKCAVRRTLLRLRLWFYIIQGLANTQWKNSASMANGGINFFACHLSLFTFKKPRWMLRTFVNCAKSVLPDVIKTPQFLRFLIATGGTKTIAHLPIADGLSFWSICIYVHF